jgi:hypothetical protein
MTALLLYVAAIKTRLAVVFVVGGSCASLGWLGDRLRARG